MIHVETARYSSTVVCGLTFDQIARLNGTAKPRHFIIDERDIARFPKGFCPNCRPQQAALPAVERASAPATSPVACEVRHVLRPSARGRDSAAAVGFLEVCR